MISIREHKREIVHRAGKRLLRAVGDFQARHSTVSTAPILPNREFPWIQQLESEWRDIRAEPDSVLTRPGDIPAFHQISPDQKRISRGDHWKTFALYVFRQPIEENCAQCPHTARLLAGLPGLQNAWFSILAPRYHIPPHRGPTRALIRCHLALRIPREREKCWLRVDNEFYRWTEGECLVFDDTYEHEVHNDTDELRVVLFMDFDRPMDPVGAWTNAALLRLLQTSHYVKDPLKNLAAWNQQRRRTAG
jgi:aspartyl/asparaginyl beta-hydroxylase (cupin superfamily)